VARRLRVLAVLPCFDEARRLPGVLARFVRPAARGAGEVLVVADGCTDASAAVARAWGATATWETTHSSRPAQRWATASP
jgi:glycosyltransferase involved in cell wall biosynthesis